MIISFAMKSSIFGLCIIINAALNAQTENMDTGKRISKAQLEKYKRTHPGAGLAIPVQQCKRLSL
jgi:hypothetical protein